MTTFLMMLVLMILSFVAGLLVGRKNPKVANAAETLAQGAEQLASKK
jgi:X-X-X-Leu-X-X-Gly heptad repeat protein